MRRRVRAAPEVIYSHAHACIHTRVRARVRACMHTRAYAHALHYMRCTTCAYATILLQVIAMAHEMMGMYAQTVRSLEQQLLPGVNAPVHSEVMAQGACNLEQQLLPGVNAQRSHLERPLGEGSAGGIGAEGQGPGARGEAAAAAAGTSPPSPRQPAALPGPAQGPGARGQARQPAALPGPAQGPGARGQARQPAASPRPRRNRGQGPGARPTSPSATSPSATPPSATFTPRQHGGHVRTSPRRAPRRPHTRAPGPGLVRRDGEELQAIVRQVRHGLRQLAREPLAQFTPAQFTPRETMGTWDA